MKKTGLAFVCIVLSLFSCERGDMFGKMSEEHCDTCISTSFYITSSTPDLTSIVNGSAAIAIYFNDTIDAASVGAGTLTISPAASLLTPAANGNAIICTANSLMTLKTYTVTLNGPIISTSGLSFTNPFSLSFTTQ